MTRFIIWASITFFTAQSYAFIQTQSCSPTGGLGQFRCGPDEIPRPVEWGTRCIAYYVNEKGSRVLDGGVLSNETANAIQASFASWTTVPDTDLIVLYGGLTNETRAEFVSSREQNANVLVWRDEEWPYASRTAFAITSVTFNPNDGLISDADIEFNGENHQFTIEDAGSVVDLQNTLTHEAGHFLGLDHSPVKDSTMFGSAPTGELEKRTLHPDDVDGISAIYPELAEAVVCSEVPTFFKKPETEEGCCATARPAQTPLFFLLLISVVTLGRSRRIRRG